MVDMPDRDDNADREINTTTTALLSGDSAYFTPNYPIAVGRADISREVKLNETGARASNQPVGAPCRVSLGSSQDTTTSNWLLVMANDLACVTDAANRLNHRIHNEWAISAESDDISRIAVPTTLC